MEFPKILFGVILMVVMGSATVALSVYESTTSTSTAEPNI